MSYFLSTVTTPCNPDSTLSYGESGSSTVACVVWWARPATFFQLSPWAVSEPDPLPSSSWVSELWVSQTPLPSSRGVPVLCGEPSSATCLPAELLVLRVVSQTQLFLAAEFLSCVEWVELSHLYWAARLYGSQPCCVYIVEEWVSVRVEPRRTCGPSGFKPEAEEGCDLWGRASRSSAGCSAGVSQDQDL